MLKTFPQVISTLSTIGRAEKGETTDVNYMEVLVSMQPLEDWPERMSYQALAAEMKERIEHEVPTVVVAATQPIQMRVEELLSGVRATLALKLYGDNLATLDRLSDKLKAALAKVPGVTDLSLEANKGKPQLAIRADREAMARYGVNASELMDVVRAGIGGESAGVVLDGTRRFDIEVWLAPDYRRDIAAIEAIPIRTKSGALVPLARLAKIELDDGTRSCGASSCRATPSFKWTQGRDVGGFVAEANEAIARRYLCPPATTSNGAGRLKTAARSRGWP